MSIPPQKNGYNPQTKYPPNGNPSGSSHTPNFNTILNQNQYQYQNSQPSLPPSNQYQYQYQHQNQHQFQNQPQRQSYNGQDYIHQKQKSDNAAPPAYGYNQVGLMPGPNLHHSRSLSTSAIPGNGGGCNGSYNSNKIEQAHEDIPRTYLIAPPLETTFTNKMFEPFRIIVPCEAPGAINGRKSDFHITAHDGYKVKNPKEFIHKHQVAVDRLCTLSLYLNMGAVVAAAHYGFGGLPNNIVEQPMRKIQNNLKNRAHANHVGLDVADYYSIQDAIDNHQRDAMRILLKAAAEEEKAGTNTGDLKGIVYRGNTYWVCDECYDKMNTGQNLNPNEHTNFREYIGLTRGDTLVDAIIRNYASAKILTQCLKNNKNVDTVLLRIVPDYFEDPDRAEGSRYRSIQNQFKELCDVLKSKKHLFRLEIFGNSRTSGQIFECFRAVFLCPDLRELRLQGLPNFLDLPATGPTGFKLVCTHLKTIILDGIQLSTDASILNLQRLIENNKNIHILVLIRVSFTPQSINALFTNKSGSSEFAKRMANLELLNLSHNDLGYDDIINILSLVTKRTKLKTLILVGNPRIGDSG
ncbi:hypothetical protein BGZ76_002887, partial [Entomortierella beljakovae]